MRLLVSILVLLFTFNVTGQSSVVDLGNWEQRGDPSFGTWSYNSTTNSVTQSRNGDPTFYVSPNNYINKTFSGLTTNQKEVTLERAQAYTWSVTSFNQRANITQTSEVHQFYLQGEGVANYAPFAPTLLTPESGKSIDAGDTLFSWEASDLDGDTLSYTLYVDTVDGTVTPPAAQTGISATQMTLTLESGKQYYFRVEASDGVNTSSSVTRSFRTK